MIAPDEEEESEREEQPELAADPLSDVSCSLISTVSAYSKLLLNEPTVGMYFVQEHVHKSVPFVLATKARIKETQKEAQLCRLDVDACLETMKVIREVGSPTLARMQASLASANRSLATLKLRSLVSSS